MTLYRSKDSLPHDGYGYYQDTWGEMIYFVLSTKSTANWEGHWDIEYQLISQNGTITLWFQSDISKNLRKIKMVGQ